MGGAGMRCTCNRTGTVGGERSFGCREATTAFATWQTAPGTPITHPTASRRTALAVTVCSMCRSVPNFTERLTTGMSPDASTNLASSSARLHGLYPPPCSLFLLLCGAIEHASDPIQDRFFVVFQYFQLQFDAQHWQGCGANQRRDFHPVLFGRDQHLCVA
jgi:hypothetical protein